MRTPALPLRLVLLLAALLLAQAAPLAAQQEADARPARNRQAFTQPLPGLDDAARERFVAGAGVFTRSWVVAPARDEAFDGLGPLHSRLACVSCHPRNSRGLAPATPQQRLQTMLIRLAQTTPDGGSQAHPVYGDQLHEEAVPGVPAEGRAGIAWETHSFRFPDGELVELRRPQVVLHALAYGPLQPALLSPRVGPAVAGLGLLEAVPEAHLLALAAQPNADGVHGRVNRVPVHEGSGFAPGRFGYKAAAASLREQSAKAMLGDLGITSTLYPQPSCTAVQTACLVAPGGGTPELQPEQLDVLTFYLSQLAIPGPVTPADTDTAKNLAEGAALFESTGCALCHRPHLPVTPGLVPGDQIAAFTDLLLHDMGEGLADGITEHQAGPRDWRTAPLWGLGLVGLIAGEEQYLHDGRARTLQEAILWHGGEAERARERFVALTPQARQALLEYLRSL